MYREGHGSEETSVRRVVALVVGVFVVGLVVLIGTRMSSDAVAVLVGVVAGVAASIPTSLLLIVVTRRRDDEVPEVYEEHRQANPSVIVVAPGGVPQVMPQYGGQYLPQQLPSVPSGRQFRVMGYDEEDDEASEGKAERQAWYG